MNTSSTQASPSETDALLASALLTIKGKPDNKRGQQNAFLINNAIGKSPKIHESPWPLFVNATQPKNTVEMLEISRNASYPSPQPFRCVNHPGQVLRGNPGLAFPLPLTSFPLGMDGRVGISSLSPAPCSSASTSFETTAVRKEHIEQALQSKPQRGKKRNNLNETERLELTRTRNREHARSTRNRKKARYEELIANEEALSMLQRQLHLDHARRQTVVDFVEVRQHMVRQFARSPFSAPLPQGGIAHLIDDLDAFVFRHGNTQEIKGLQGMGRFDETVVSRTKDRFGADATSLLTYSKSFSGVALRLDNTACIDVELFLQGQTNTTITLLSANLLVVFSSETSSKISSVEWRTMQDKFNEVAVDRLSSYPSVVSLDPATGLDND